MITHTTDHPELVIPTLEQTVTWLMSLPDEHLFGLVNEDVRWGQGCPIGQHLEVLNPGAHLFAGYRIVQSPKGVVVGQLSAASGVLATIFDSMLPAYGRYAFTAKQVRDYIAHYWLVVALQHASERNDA